MSNKIYMVYFTEGEIEKILTKANAVLNPKGVKLKKANIFKLLMEYVINHNKDVLLSYEELNIILSQGRDDRLILPRIEPYKTLINKLIEIYRQKYGEYFLIANRKIGYTNALRIAVYEFLKLIGEEVIDHGD